MLNNEDMIIDVNWPHVNEKLLIENLVELVIQVNGKLRGKIEIETGLGNEEVEVLALKNENVHNFALNILAKGGILQFLLFFAMYLSLIGYWYQKNKNFKLLGFITFSLMTAFFDVAMESVRFPFIFFGSIAYLFNEN